MQIIPETAGPFLHQGAPRPTRPLALERRRLLLELGTARRLTGSSGDQSLVETAKTEITRVCDAFLVGPREDEGQCGLRNWKKASENRSLSQFTDSHVSSLAQALGGNTVVFGQIRAYTPSQIEWAQGLAKEGPKGGLAQHENTWTDFRREHLELLDPGESETTGRTGIQAARWFTADGNQVRHHCMLGIYSTM